MIMVGGQKRVNLELKQIEFIQDRKYSMSIDWNILLLVPEFMRHRRISSGDRAPR
jgi:hypothetical protein